MQTLYFIVYDETNGFSVESAQQDEKAIHTGFQNGSSFLPSWMLFETPEQAQEQLCLLKAEFFGGADS